MVPIEIGPLLIVNTSRACVPRNKRIFWQVQQFRLKCLREKLRNRPIDMGLSNHNSIFVVRIRRLQGYDGFRHLPAESIRLFFDELLRRWSLGWLICLNIEYKCNHMIYRRQYIDSFTLTKKSLLESLKIWKMGCHITGSSHWRLWFLNVTARPQICTWLPLAVIH